MIKAFKHIVVLLFVLAQVSAYAQYTGGSADGASTDQYTLTVCGTPDQFYAYMGGSGDGAVTNQYTLTTCGTPPQFYAFMGGNADGFATNQFTLTTCGTPAQYYAYMGGNADGFATNQYTLTTCGNPPQFYAYMGGNADGFATNQFTLTTCGTPSQFYAYMGGNGDGFSKDTLTKCPTAPPVASFSASATTVCVGTTVNFTDHSTQSPSAWTWTFQGGTPTTFTVQNPSVVYNSPGTFSVSLTAVNTMGSNTYTVANYITVVATPTVSAGSDVAICTGSSATLTATGATTYSWTPSTGLSATNISNPVANPTVTTTYSVTGTTSGCSATDAMTVTVNAIPVAAAGNDVSICNGSSTTFSASGGTTYSWTPSTGLSSTSASNPAASPTVTTTYSVTVTTAGCSSTDALTVTVNSLPTANAGSDVAICNLTSTTLTATGGPSYSWSPATGLSSTTIANPVASPTTTTNYTVTVTDINSCSASDVMTVTVNPLPAANAGSDITICTGSSATLTASGGVSYTWTPATGLSATNISNPVANPTVTTNYTVSVTDANGCQASDNITVNVTTTLTANAGSDVVICLGSSTNLSASGGATYVWTPTTGLTNPNIANPSASPTVTTTYSVTVSSGGCSSTDNVIVTVNPNPTVTVTASGPTTFCAGDSVILTSSASTTYTWSTGLHTQSIKVTANGSYYVSVQNTFGCQTISGSTNVTVHPLGTASITPGGATTFCQGGSLTLTANNGAAYSWTGGATTQSINVTASGTYTVSVDDIFGCAVPSPTASINITVNPNPAAPTITAVGTTSNLCIGDTVIFKCSPATSYSWSTGATTDSIIATTAGSYSVTAFNSFGCGTTSSASNLTVNNPLVDFTADSLLVFIPSAVVNFTATVSGFPPYTYLWNFGDGNSSTSIAPTHTYNTIGYDTVSLTLTDSTGCSKKMTKLSYIEVEQLFPSYAMVTGTTLNLTGLSFLDAVKGIITLTDGNCILSVDSGNHWSSLPTGNTNALTGASILPGNWFVTGVNGTILNSTNDGGTWTTYTTGTTETFNGCDFSSATNGFAVGTNGTIQKFNGVSWSPQTSGTPNHLNNVYAFSSGDAIAAGDNQTMLYYNGVSWSPQTFTLSMDIKSVKFTSPTFGYAAGTNGNVLQTNNAGSSWVPSLTGVNVDFNSVEAIGIDTAWATGTGGIVYRTLNSGATWVRYSVGSLDNQSNLQCRGGKGHISGSGGNGRNFDGRSAGLGVDLFGGFKNDFTVFPNPAKNDFTISAKLTQSEKLTIEIKDVQGKLIERIVNSNVSGDFTVKVNSENYMDGVYFIHIRQGEKSWVQKVVISR
jgi:PKD repeat protein